jgi:pyruvate/2-oxoglutarate dehydrogenase complex dihydrolipoamide dehydrogenase (E3) component
MSSKEIVREHLKREYDVVVVGAGLAGRKIAIALKEQGFVFKEQESDGEVLALFSKEMPRIDNFIPELKQATANYYGFSEGKNCGPSKNRNAKWTDIAKNRAKNKAARKQRRRAKR